MAFSEAFLGVKTNGFGNALDSSLGVLVIVETRGISANDFGEGDGFETECRIGGFGNFASVATVFVKNKAAVGFFEPFNGFKVPAVDELVFVIKDIEVSVGDLHDVGKKVEMISGEVLSLIDDDVLELVIVIEIIE